MHFVSVLLKHTYAELIYAGNNNLDPEETRVTKGQNTNGSDHEETGREEVPGFDITDTWDEYAVVQNVVDAVNNNFGQTHPVILVPNLTT